MSHLCGAALGEATLLAAVPAGGDEGNRTPNPRLAKAVLCQLSYVPRVGPGAQRAVGLLTA